MSLAPPGRPGGPGRDFGWIGGWALSLLGAAMLMWTALANGRPAVFSDTALYFGEAEYLFQALHLVDPGQAVTPPNDPTDLPKIAGAPSMPAAIDGARSPLYGAAVYALQRLGGLWLVAFAQAWAASAMVYLLVRAAAPQAPQWSYVALMAGLALLTPLPFFAGWIMPDLLAGVAACGLLLLLVYLDRLGRRRWTGVAALTAFGLAAHRSNLLDAAALTGLAAALLKLTGVAGPEIARRVAGVAAVMAAAVLAGALLYIPIRARAGEPIGSPPFLSARVIADGPGRLYLRWVCAKPGPPAFALCAFAGRPLATSDQILWSPRRREGVFVAASSPVRLQMERQDVRFALDEVLAEPLPQTLASSSDVFQQFVQAYVDDPLRNQGFYVADRFWRATSLPRILPDARACAGKGGCPPRITEAVSWTLEGVGLAASLLALAWRLSAPDVRTICIGKTKTQHGSSHDDVSRLLVLLVLVAGLLAANAVFCGALSGPFPRYQARLIWLVPLLAGLVVARLGPYRRPAAGRQSSAKDQGMEALARVDALEPPL